MFRVCILVHRQLLVKSLAAAKLAQVFPKGGTCMQAELFHAGSVAADACRDWRGPVEIYGTGRK